MNYKEFKAYSNEVVNSLEIGFAFSNEQFNELLIKKGWKKEDLVQCFGGVCPKNVYADNRKKLNDLNLKEIELLKDDDFLYGALVYELQNHEYSYTYETEDTLDSLGLTYNELNDSQKAVLKKATEFVLANCDC